MDQHEMFIFKLIEILKGLCVCVLGLENLGRYTPNSLSAANTEWGQKLTFSFIFFGLS